MGALTGRHRAVVPPPAERHRNERYRRLIELAPDAILVHDDGMIVLANASAARLAGAASPSELAGQSIGDFLDPPYLKAVQAQLIETGVDHDVTAPTRDTFRRLDGSELQVEVRAVAFADGSRTATHLVVRDITTRLSAEEDARKAQAQLDQARHLEAVGAVAGGVAHEVHNMMTVVLGVADFLLGDARLPEVFVNELRELAAAAGQAATISRQLLAFSRQAAYRPRKMDLSAVMRDIEPLLRKLLGERHQLAVVTGPPARASVDADQLTDMVINLVLNARDAMTDGGTLTITTAQVTVDQSVPAATTGTIPPGEYAVLQLHDTGIGMSDAVRQRMFEPFFTASAVGGHAGLGLAAVEGAVAQNHGHVTVSSVVGEGTTISVYLPLVAPAEIVPVLGAPEPDPAPIGATVVVVDDLAAVRSVVARPLERRGFRVLQAESGPAALQLMEHHGRPDLVITDLAMPEMNGIDLAEALHAQWPGLPVLFMSGFAGSQLDGGSPMTAEADVLHKPFTIEQLLNRVDAALSRPAQPSVGAA